MLKININFPISEGPEIRHAADRISKVLLDKEIIESNFYYERIRDKGKNQ
tara:strand:+ start:579 stop:728 length:150 start_codon:yes stop_codon:yes gene_type:complete